MGRRHNVTHEEYINNLSMDGEIDMSRSFLRVRKGLTFLPLSAPPSDPSEGDIYFDTTLQSLQTYRSGSWVPMPGGAGTVLATAIDETSITLPSVNPVTIDGHVVITGDRVLFTNLSSNNNKLYEATVTGGTVTWESTNVFAEGSDTPSKGNIVRVQNGDENELIGFIFDDTNWVTEDDHSTIGVAEDSTYTDGLFTDFDNKTPLGTAIDRFNEVLKELAPSPAPTLNYQSFSVTGVDSSISWGALLGIPSYWNVNGIGSTSAVGAKQQFPYQSSGQRKGAHQPTDQSGTLADNVPQGDGSPTPSYPTKSFGSGDKGEIRLTLNGVVIHTVDLTTFASGVSVNGNGSGFTLTAATPVSFPGGGTLDLFKYRQGSYIVKQADQRLGWNYMRIDHYFDGSSHYTNYYEWVNDSNSSALSGSGGSLHTLNMTGSKYLSGVEYYTAGTALYDVDIDEVYTNLYSRSSTAVSYNEVNGNIPSESIPNWSLDETETLQLTNKVFTITSTKLLNESITAGVSCLHPLKSNLVNASPATIYSILMDSASTSSTAIREYFTTENIRLESTSNTSVNNYAAQADVATGAWDSSESIASTGNNGYKDGLLYYNDYLCYPTQGANNGNFSAITNGPSGNVNYNAETGTRYAYIKFQNNTGSTKSNFKVNLTGSGTGFNNTSTGPVTNNVTMEMKFPTGSISSATGWLDCYSDFATGSWNDGDGCRNATAGGGRALSTDWGITVGTKSIANGEYIVVRIAASANWTGNINNINLTWL